MLERKKRKKPQSKKTYTTRYNQYCFRVPIGKEEEFQQVLLALDEVHALYESIRTKDQQVFKRNDIIIEALRIGLLQMGQGLYEERQ
jgi:hypothetical protein